MTQETFVSIQPKPKNGLEEEFEKTKAFLESVSIQPKPKNGLEVCDMITGEVIDEVVSIQPKPKNGLEEAQMQATTLLSVVSIQPKPKNGLEANISYSIQSYSRFQSSRSRRMV